LDTFELLSAELNNNPCMTASISGKHGLLVPGCQTVLHISAARDDGGDNWNSIRHVKLQSDQQHQLTNT